MKRLRHCWVVALAVLALAGCEGPAGPEGPVGPEGPPGAAGVVVREVAYGVSDLTISGKAATLTVAVPELTAAVHAQGFVLCYLAQGEAWAALPRRIDVEGSPVEVTFSHEPGRLRVQFATEAGSFVLSLLPAGRLKMVLVPPA